MEKELLTKLLETAEETNKTINIMSGAIINMQQDIAGIKAEQKTMKQDIEEIKEEQKAMKQDIEEIKEEQKAMKHDIEEIKEEQKAMKHDIKVLKRDVAYIKSQQGYMSLEQILIKDQLKLLNAKIAREMDDAGTNHQIIFKNLALIMSTLNLKMISDI